MADKWPLATGNWSNAANWNGGTLPTSSDDVYADGKTVTIDQNITVLSVRTTQRSGGTTGGGFTLSDGFNITANILAGSSVCVTYAGTSAITINGNITGSASNAAAALLLTSTGAVTINGNLAAGTASSSFALNSTNATGGPITITGNLDGSTSGNTSAVCVTTAGSLASVTVTGNLNSISGVAQGAISTSGTSATVTVTGTVGGGGGEGCIATSGANASVTVTGNVSGRTNASNGAGAGIKTTGNGTTRTVTVTGTVTAGSPATGLGAHGIWDTNTSGGWVIVSGSLIDSAQGDCAVSARRFRCVPTLSTTRQHANNTGYPSGGMITYGSLDYIPNNVPVPSNVRQGTVYGNNTFTGTCAVPAAASVGYGVPVDNTTGTAALSPADVAALVGAQITATLTSTP